MIRWQLGRGDPDTGVHFIAQAQGLVHDVPSVGEIARRTVIEAGAILEYLSALC